VVEHGVGRLSVRRLRHERHGDRDGVARVQRGDAPAGWTGVLGRADPALEVAGRVASRSATVKARPHSLAGPSHLRLDRPDQLVA
jgi:hypothetical protein